MTSAAWTIASRSNPNDTYEALKIENGMMTEIIFILKSVPKIISDSLIDLLVIIITL